MPSALRIAKTRARAVSSTAPDRALPLRYRLPNPPAVFFGRQLEVDQLAAAISRAPVSLVHGLGGLGKTSLVLHTLFERFSSEVPRTIFVGLRPSDPPVDPQIEVLRACAAALGVTALDWPALLSDVDMLASATIDLADEGGFLVVIDDIHHGDAASTRSLLGNAARHARRARWIVTTRVDPEAPDLRGQSVRLGALSDEDVAALARACAPHLHGHQISRVVVRAAGSPWRIHALIDARIADAESDELSLLAELPPEAVRFAEALAMVRAPLSLRTIRRFVAVPSEETIALLRRRGMIEAGADGLRLHDVACGLIRRSLTPARRVELETEAAEALVEDDDPVAILELLRLLVALGDGARADATLTRRFTVLARDGYAAALASLLETSGCDELARWRVHCTIELGDPSLLARAVEPRSDRLEDALAWCRVLFLRGELRAARDRAGEVRDAAVHAADTSIVFRATIVLARALLATGEGERAVALLSSMSPFDAEQDAIRGAALLEGYLAVRRFAEVEPCVDALMALRDRLTTCVRREVGRQLVVVFVQFGWLRRADELLHRWVIRADEGGGLLSHFDAYHEMLVLLGTGQFDEAATALASLGAYSSQTSVWQCKTRMMQLVRRFAVGELGEIDEAFDEALRGAEQVGLSFDYGLCLAVRDAVALVRGVPGPPLEWPAGLARVPGTGLNLARVRREIRLGAATFTDEQRAWWQCSDHVLIGRARLLARMARVEAALVASRLDEAVQLAEETIAMARADGWILTELDVRQLLCEALLLLGRDEALAHAAGELLALAVRTRSRRFEAHGLFLQTVASRGPVRPEVLEVNAQLVDVAPDLARRSRALLGAPAVLDAVDRLLVQHLHARAPRVTFVRGRDGDARCPGLGVDGERTAVWFASGRLLEMAERPTLFRILTALAERRGAATKGELAADVWGLADYHPLRDDKRLQVAIRKLRLLIEEDPSRPARILTTETGYAFGTDEEVRWIRGVEAE